MHRQELLWVISLVPCSSSSCVIMLGLSSPFLWNLEICITELVYCRKIVACNRWTRNTEHVNRECPQSWEPLLRIEDTNLVWVSALWCQDTQISLKCLGTHHLANEGAWNIVFWFLALLCFWIISKLILKFNAIREQHA